MTQSTSDAFLSGQGIPVEPSQIESELIRLWGSEAERVGGPEPESPNVTRVVLANLVVEAGPDSPECLEANLDTVVARYPCRAIVLRRTVGAGRKVSAEVAALCHLGSPGKPQVCSERIVLTAGPEAVDLFPGSVRPLLEANLPFVLWWTDDPRPVEGLFRDLAGECSRLVLDLPDPSSDLGALKLGLDQSINPYIRDTAWFGITRWRELVAQFFDGLNCADLIGRLTAVEIKVEVPGVNVEKVPRVAAWLVAWLAGQLGWTPVDRRELEPGQLEATFRGPSGDVAIKVQTQASGEAAGSQILGVSLTARTSEGPETLRVTRRDPRSPQVRVDVSSPTSCALPRVIHSPELDAPGRVAAALESSRIDPPFTRALPHALWLLGDASIS